MHHRLSHALLFVLLIGAVAVAQVQVGSISGVVRDPSGAPLAGATVTAESPVLVEPQTTTTNTEGYYRLTYLKPGTYTLKVTSSEYQMFEAAGIRVRINDKLRINITLEEITGDTVVITGSTPLIQVEKTEIDAVLTNEIIANMPVLERDYTEMIQLLPGISPQVDGNMIGPSIAGGRGRQVVWVVDGVENVDDYYGLDATYVSQDAIEEIQVIQSGFSVVNGRGSAAVVNVVTKSGTERLSGKLYGYYRDDSFDEEHADEPFKWSQYGVQVGGPLIPEQTHYFAQLELFDSQTTKKSVDPWGDVKYYKDDSERNNYLVRIDHRLMDNNVFSAKFNYAPRNRLYPATNSTRPIRDARIYDYKSTNFTVNDRHLFSDELILESTFQFNHYGQEMSKNSDDPSDYFYYRWVENGVSQSEIFGNAGTMDRDQKSYQFIEKVQYFQDTSLDSNMQWTVGLDAKKTNFYYQYDMTYSYYYYPNSSPDDPNGIPSYKRMYDGNDRIEADSTQLAAYVQNDWQLSRNLTVNLGMRIDHNTYWEINDFSPRVGVSFDPFGKGKTVIRGGIGVFKDRDILYRIQQVEKPASTYYYPVVVNGTWDGTSWTKSTPVTTTYYFTDGIKTPYVIDSSIGIEHEIYPNYRVSATYMYKDGRNRWYSIWKNIDPDADDYDPSMRQMCYYGNQAWSRYHSLMFELYKRFADRFTFDISYTWSRSVGNGYHYTSFLDTYVSSEPQLEDWRLNQVFKLNNDVPHNFKIYGMWQIPVIDVLVAGSYFYRSGYPFTAQNYSTRSLVGEINGFRNPAQQQVDVRFEKIFKFRRFTFKPKVDIFNLTNKENVTSLYNLENYDTFLEPRNWGPHRQFQVGFDFMW